MRKIAIAAGATALLASTAVAFAADTGTITSIDWANGVVTLDNGHTYIVPEQVQSKFPMGVGEKISVEADGMTVTSISKAS